MRNARFLPFLLVAFVLLAIPASSSAQIGVALSVRIGPPSLPIYAQPLCPGAGYIWTPGYWSYANDDFFWVPGTWVLAPRVGFLWTPGYWGWGGGLFLWHAGYWGPHVGFYGGINYGFGYGGVGFVGGMWAGGVFRYNTAVSNVGVNIHNTYINRTVINNTNVTRVSYNGGTGGVTARPTSAELSAVHGQHINATSEQVQHEHTASTNRSQFYSANHGQPSVAGTSKAGEFGGNHSGATNRPMNANRTTTGNNNAGNPNNASNTARGTGNNPPPHNAGNNTGKTGSNTGGNRGGNNGGKNTGKSTESKPPKNPPKSPPKGGDDKGKDRGGR